MGGSQWVWLLAGAAAVVAAIAAVRLHRFLGAGQAETCDAYGPRVPEENRRASPSGTGDFGVGLPSRTALDVPYGIDNRPMPAGDDLEALLPGQVGAFRRAELRPLGDIHSMPVYATYWAGDSEVFIELGICGSPSRAQEGLETAKREMAAEGDSEIQACSIGTDPSFVKDTNPRLGAFLGWTRGGYYFSAHAKRGEADLDAFVKAFPY